jgi:predicted phosphoribosyltransferase
MTYRDRPHAGNLLAERLAPYAGRPDVVVLGLVRGGLPVAASVARRLGLPLDALVIRKLGVPWAPEVAFGAIGPGGVRILNDEVVSRLAPAAVTAVLRHEAGELARREARYRSGRQPLVLDGRTALIVDDGLATGATARAAVAVARAMGAARVVVAVPVGSTEAITQLAQTADEVVCPWQPLDFGAVSRFYDDFGQVSDEQAVALLSGTPGPEHAPSDDSHVHEPREV